MKQRDCYFDAPIKVAESCGKHYIGQDTADLKFLIKIYLLLYIRIMELYTENKEECRIYHKRWLGAKIVVAGI